MRMKSNRRMSGFVRALTAALSLAFVVPAVTAAPAHALTNVGTISGVEARCNNSAYLLCLYYEGLDSAWWGTSGDVSDLAGHRFTSGANVKNNAWYVSCDASSTSICYIFFNSGYSGPRDWLYGQRSGKLVETYNENASVRISIGP